MSMKVRNTPKITNINNTTNCGKGYKCTIFAFKAGLGFNAGVVYIQKPFLGKKKSYTFGV